MHLQSYYILVKSKNSFIVGTERELVLEHQSGWGGFYKQVPKDLVSPELKLKVFLKCKQKLNDKILSV